MQVFSAQGAAPYYTNSFVLVGDKGSAVIVDPAASKETYEKILTEHSARLTYILLTHGHHDHVTAVEALHSAYGAAVYLGEGDSRGNRLFPLKNAYNAYTDGQRIAVDDMVFHIIATPGHSQGCVCILCGDLLFSGDTLFAGDVGRTDLEGSDPQAMLCSLKKLADAVPDSAQVLPGHEAFSQMSHEKQSNRYVRQAQAAQ